MAELLSSCFYARQRIPEKYVVPPEKRPGNYVKANVPVVDLHDHDHKNNNTIHQLMKASQDFGFFQVVNHGVPSDLLDEAMQIFKEVFNLPHEEKLKINKEDDTNGVCKIFTNRRDNNNETGEKAHFWRDALTHYINNPLEECIKFWPQNPEKYREIVKAYVIAIESLGSRILELVAQGLGIEQGYFGGKLGGEGKCCLQVNHYPPCPEPDLTLGLEKHADVSLITILLQGTVPGLQLLLKDGQWMGVETLPHALLVFIGNQLEVVSNGKLRSGIHRVVTNASKARTSAAFLIAPLMDCIVEPAKTLADNERPLYKPFLYKDVYEIRRLNLDSKEEYEDVLDIFKIKA